jgi:Skp family chaperone for outer membrane proteins
MDVISYAPVQYGALGTLIVLLLGAVIAIWRQWIIDRKQLKKELEKERAARDVERKQNRQELIDLNDKLVTSQNELQSLLKGLAHEFEIKKEITKLFQEYIKSS